MVRTIELGTLGKVPATSYAVTEFENSRRSRLETSK
jgi:hypothetical protein